MVLINERCERGLGAAYIDGQTAANPPYRPGWRTRQIADLLKRRAGHCKRLAAMRERYAYRKVSMGGPRRAMRLDNDGVVDPTSYRYDAYELDGLEIADEVCDRRYRFARAGSDGEGEEAGRWV
jgi:hypothetical protein